MKTCRGCAWWNIKRTYNDWNPARKEEDQAECRASPPTLFDNRHMGEWPRTEARDWCRSFEPRSCAKKAKTQTMRETANAD